MNRYYCQSCQKLIDDDDLKTVCERVGEYMGQDAYETYSVCPHCGSIEIEEAERCEKCGEYVAPEELIGGVCLDCFKSLVTPENVRAYLDGLEDDFVAFTEARRKTA